MAAPRRFPNVDTRKHVLRFSRPDPCFLSIQLTSATPRSMVKSQKVKKMSEECLKVIGISFRLFYVKSYELRVLSHLPFIEWFYRLHVISSKLILLNEFADVTTSFDVTGGSSSLLYRWWWRHAWLHDLLLPPSSDGRWKENGCSDFQKIVSHVSLLVNSLDIVSILFFMAYPRLRTRQTTRAV